MKLRRLVRGAINAVNNDQQITWLASVGFTLDPATGKGTPVYAGLQTLWAQIQPVSTDQLGHMDNLNIQGVLRSVYMKNAVASAVREDGTGGDLLQFPQMPGGELRVWLVMSVDEQWDSWCRVTVRMQNDINNRVIGVLADGSGQFIITGAGQPIQVTPSVSS